MKLYAFLDIDDPFVAWESSIGRISSVKRDSVKLMKNDIIPISLWFYRSLLYGNKDKLYYEKKIDEVRKKYFPNEVSRIKSIYFFKSIEEAIYASRIWFNKNNCKDYISEIDFNEEKISGPFDANWYEFLSSYMECNDFESLTRQYWNGEICPYFDNQKPVFEMLGEGYGKILNVDLVEKAQEKILSLYPDASLFMVLGYVGYNICDILHAAQVIPVISRDEKVLTGGFIIDEKDVHEKQETIGIELKKLQDQNRAPNYKIPNNPEVAFRLPDLKDLFLNIDLEKDQRFKEVYDYFDSIYKMDDSK